MTPKVFEMLWDTITEAERLVSELVDGQKKLEEYLLAAGHQMDHLEARMAILERANVVQSQINLQHAEQHRRPDEL